jgi:cytochrome c biogenesis protein CcdA
MFELLAIVGSLGLADSLNPSTIVPAFYLGTQPHARTHLMGFTAGVFGVSMIGGLILVLGPGQLLLDLVPKPAHHTRHILQLGAGVVALIGAAVLWRVRRRKFGSEPDAAKAPSGRSSVLLGAGIMAVELPTAIPYFAAIALIVGSDRGLITQVLVLTVYNVLFVAPLLAILGAHLVAPQRTERALAPIGAWLRTHAIALLAILIAVAGVVLVALGVKGLVWP